MTDRALRYIRPAAIAVVALAWSPAVAAPETPAVDQFDALIQHFDQRSKSDPTGLRAQLLGLDRDGLDDERWIDLHVALMKLSERSDAPKRGLPQGTTPPSAASSHPFDKHVHRQGLRPLGEAAYAHKLRTTHGLDMSPMRVLRMGKRARASIQAELGAFAEEHGDGATWQEMALREREDCSSSIGELRLRYDRFTAEATQFVVERGLVTVPEEAKGLRVITQKGRFNYAFVYYLPGNDWKAGKSGRVVMGREPRGLSKDALASWYGEFNDHFLRVVAVHEGVPGHHLQFTRAASAYRGMRKRAYNSVYVEGWGLYCEGLLERHGYLTDPLDRLAELRMRAWRAVRCYVDPALHAGLIRPSDAAHLLIDEAAFSRRAAEMEIERYMRDPTQPIGYWVGRQRIERIRDAYLEQHGEDAEREFHDRLLGFGSVPLPLAEAVLLGRRHTYDTRHPSQTGSY